MRIAVLFSSLLAFGCSSGVEQELADPKQAVVPVVNEEPMEPKQQAPNDEPKLAENVEPELQGDFLVPIVVKGQELGTYETIREGEKYIKHGLYKDTSAKGYYDHGKKTGKWIDYLGGSYEGEGEHFRYAASESNYVNGKKDGEWKLFADNQRKELIGIFVFRDGKRIDLRQF